MPEISILSLLTSISIFLISCLVHNSFNSSLTDDNSFKKVWAKRDPDVTTKENELMIEYYSRVAFAEENFSRGTSGGWRSDMGMIYILFGRPDDVSRSMNPQQSYNYEIWYYYKINEEFTFVDDFGFGDYRLRTPFMY